MRHLLLALPLALLPAFAPAHEHHEHHEHEHEHEHGSASLGSHEHGAAQLDAALDGDLLEIELRSPAMNLLGFEYMPKSAEDRRQLAGTRALLEQPDALFGLPSEALCELDEVSLESPLFADEGHRHAQHDVGAHNDIHALYRYSCSAPDALSGLDLRGLFKAFPGTETIQAQLIGPNGQQGKLLRATQAQITF